MNLSPKLLITGASGFTGQHAYRYFMEAGFDVVAVARKPSFDNQIPIECCDFTDKEAVKNIIKKIKPQYTLHLAGQNHVGDSWIDPISTLETNCISTLYLIEALRNENPSCKIIVVGSALQFSPENIFTLKHPYSLSKTLQVLVAQSWVTLYNMNIVIAKPSNLIGPGFSNGVCSMVAKKIVDIEESKGEKVLRVHNLDVQRNFIDVRDVVKAYEILFTKGKAGEIYNVSSGKSCSLREVINIFRNLTSGDIKFKSQINNKIEQEFEISSLKLMDLGWNPSINLELSLKETLNFYRNLKTKGN